MRTIPTLKRFIMAVLILTQLAVSVESLQAIDEFEEFDFQQVSLNNGVFYFEEELGRISMTPVYDFPCLVQFSQGPESNSGELGDGWFMPFLEGRAYKIADAVLRVQLPWGDTRDMSRVAGSTTEYTDSNAEWSATENTNTETITISHADGTQVKYVHGVIKELIIVGNAKLNWTRNGNDVEVKLNDITTVASLKMESAITWKLGMGNRTLGITKIGPSATITDGLSNVLTAEVSRLSNSETFTCALRLYDDPVRSFVFNGRSGLIVSDSGDGAVDYSYQIKTQRTERGALALLEIARTTTPGNFQETYRVDVPNGEAVFIDKNGVEMKKLLFLTPGPLFLKPRKIVYKKPNQETSDTRLSYDANGRVIRSVDDGKVETTYQYGSDGDLTLATRNNRTIFQRLTSGQQITETYYVEEDDVTLQFKYEADSAQVEMKVTDATNDSETFLIPVNDMQHMVAEFGIRDQIH